MTARFAPGLFVVLWATGFIGARYAMPHAEPFTFLAIRFALTFALLAPFVALSSARRLRPRDAAHAAIAGGLMHGLYLGLAFLAIRRGFPAGYAALVVGLQPLITALIASGVLGDRISPRQWAGLAIGFAGVAAVLGPKLGDVGHGVDAINLMAATAAVLAMSLGTVWQKRFAGHADLVGGAFWQYFGGMVLMAAGAFAFETRVVDWTGELIFALAWLVLVLSIGAIFLLMLLIRQGEIARVASLFYLVPPVTAVMAYFLFGETLTPFQIGGIAVACAGVALATRR